MSHLDEHEAKAREWIESAPIGRLGLAYPETVHSLAALLRSVAEDARREEAEPLEKLLMAIADDADHGGPINAGLNSVQDVLYWRDEILRRRGAKR